MYLTNSFAQTLLGDMSAGGLSGTYLQLYQEFPNVADGTAASYSDVTLCAVAGIAAAIATDFGSPYQDIIQNQNQILDSITFQVTATGSSADAVAGWMLLDSEPTSSHVPNVLANEDFDQSYLIQNEGQGFVLELNWGQPTTISIISELD